MPTSGDANPTAKARHPLFEPSPSRAPLRTIAEHAAAAAEYARVCAATSSIFQLAVHDAQWRPTIAVCPEWAILKGRNGEKGYDCRQLRVSNIVVSADNSAPQRDYNACTNKANRDLARRRLYAERMSFAAPGERPPHYFERLRTIDVTQTVWLRSPAYLYLRPSGAILRVKQWVTVSRPHVQLLRYMCAFTTTLAAAAQTLAPHAFTELLAKRLRSLEHTLRFFNLIMQYNALARKRCRAKFGGDDWWFVHEDVFAYPYDLLESPPDKHVSPMGETTRRTAKKSRGGASETESSSTLFCHVAYGNPAAVESAKFPASRSRCMTFNDGNVQGAGFRSVVQVIETLRRVRDNITASHFGHPNAFSVVRFVFTNTNLVMPGRQACLDLARLPDCVHPTTGNSLFVFPAADFTGASTTPEVNPQKTMVLFATGPQTAVGYGQAKEAIKLREWLIDFFLKNNLYVERTQLSTHGEQVMHERLR